ncbi:hypothetical protein [Streptomyces phytohabitans]|uniref:hypothetical protein n=1 Tax=Streptomyces phytohabitans TaxID=1150371 RepID=UPI00345BD35A
MTGRDAGAGKGDESEPVLPPDEEAAWAAIVAAYGDVPAVGLGDGDGDGDRGDDGGDRRTGAGAGAVPGKGPGAADGRAEEADGDAERPEGDAHDGDADGARDDSGRREPDGDTLTRSADDGRDGADGGGPPVVRSVTVYAAGTGPRDWTGADEDDEGHFVPPEPPPLPEADPTTKFAWIAVLGGPLLLLAAVLFRFDMTWWIVTLGVGGFLGGFGTLVARMRDDRDDDGFEDPGRGAVV